MLSFAESSKLAVVWFFVPNAHQFLRIVYASWSPSHVFAFDTLYWAIAIEVRRRWNFSKFQLFIKSFLHSIKNFLKGILHLADNPPLGSSRLHFAKSEKRPTVLGDQAASSASAQKTALFGIESIFQRQSVNISWVWKSRAMPSGLWNSWWW